MKQKKDATAAPEVWKVTKTPAKPEKRSWIEMWRRRREPSTYQRCLAVHIHYAAPRGGFS